MSPIYTFFQSAGIKENHRYEVNYYKNDTKIKKIIYFISQHVNKMYLKGSFFFFLNYPLKILSSLSSLKTLRSSFNIIFL